MPEMGQFGIIEGIEEIEDYGLDPKSVRASGFLQAFRFKRQRNRQRASCMDDWRRAIAAIKEADYLLIAAGAGLSADSGLPVYADAALVEAYQRRDLSYQELCDPSLLLTDPACAYGFWVECLEKYRRVAPHPGYAILERWLSARPPHATATYTSNVDGHLRRFSALRRNLCEVHGCLEEWMCGSSMCFVDTHAGDPVLRRGAHWEAYHLATRRNRSPGAGSSGADNELEPLWMSGCAEVRATPPSGWRVQIDAEHSVRLHPPHATRIPTGAKRNDGDANGGNKHGGNDGDANGGNGRDGSGGANADAASCLSGSRGDSVDWDVMPPLCSRCGTQLRPAVLMFGDTDPVLLGRLRDAASAYQRWEDAMEEALVSDRSLSVAVVEIGCGTRVPSVRVECEQVVADVNARGGRATLVRINPEAHPEECAEVTPQGEGASESLDQSAIVHLHATALDALTKIDASLS